jgi:hypothetical protein
MWKKTENRIINAKSGFGENGEVVNSQSSQLEGKGNGVGYPRMATTKKCS